MVYIISLVISIILFLCIKQTIQDSTKNIKIITLIVFTYLAFKAYVSAENERLTINTLATNSNKENDVRTKLSSATLHTLEGSGYIWGILFIFSKQIDYVISFLLGLILKKEFPVFNPYSDWISIDIYVCF